jgi:hypothetical protein
MVVDPKKAESIPLTIPVTADALDARGAVVKSMGQYSDFGFG